MTGVGSTQGYTGVDSKKENSEEREEDNEDGEEESEDMRDVFFGIKQINLHV